MTNEARELRRVYKREYRRRNRDKVNQQQREWRTRNPEKVKEYQKKYWERKAEKDHGQFKK